LLEIDLIFEFCVGNLDCLQNGGVHAYSLDERRPPFAEYAARRVAYALREVDFSTNGVQHLSIRYIRLTINVKLFGPSVQVLVYDRAEIVIQPGNSPRLKKNWKIM
jgi:hypothetical protein